MKDEMKAAPDSRMPQPAAQGLWAVAWRSIPDLWKQTRWVSVTAVVLLLWAGYFHNQFYQKIVRENFIDDKHIGLDVSCHRKGQSYVHARTVAFDRHVEKSFGSRKIDDLVEFAENVGPGHAQDCTIQKDIFPPR